MFFAGVATFAQLYSFQPLLPALTRTFEVSAAAAALTVSAATLGLAASVIPWSSFADAVGRVPAMRLSVIAATLLGLAALASPRFELVVAFRLLEGCALGGVPAVAMAYVNEEVHRDHAARAGAIYVAGTSIGGLAGREVSGPVAHWTGHWNVGVAATLTLCVAAALVFTVLVPPARGFVPHRARPGDFVPRGSLVHKLAVNLRDRRTRTLFIHGFLLMGAFVAMYNYLGFHLEGSPYQLPSTVVDLMFLAYLVGTVGSYVTGSLAERFGRRRVYLAFLLAYLGGTALTLAAPLWLIVTGLLLLTAGFFGAHAIAQSWAVALAPGAKAQASSLYNLFYYAGSSALGWSGGQLMDWFGWPGVAGMVMAAVALIVLTVLPAARTWGGDRE
jgi:predicted MFS family arabinose efflux permease